MSEQRTTEQRACDWPIEIGLRCALPWGHKGDHATSNLVAAYLIVDDERTLLPETGIYIRAQQLDGKWGSWDLAHLTRKSVLIWLRSRGGQNLWAESTVLILLGWPGIQEGKQ